MSLKRERKGHSAISRFLAALLRPSMPDPPPPQLPYLFFHSPDTRHTENVADWNSHLLQHLDDHDDHDENYYARCFLRHIEYCKCSRGVKHEFLVFHFGHWTGGSSAVGVVCADRTVDIHLDNSSSSGQSSGHVSPSSTDIIVHDTVTIIGSPRDATWYLTNKYGSFKTLRKLQFFPPSPPSALQVSVVLALVYNHSSIHHIYKRQHYWFTNTIWKSLKRLFPQNEELYTRHNICCRRGPFQLGPSDESVGVVCGNYEAAWNNTLEQMNQAKSTARRGQIRAIVRAEWRHEIEEIQARAQQREREMQAQAQQREHEMQAQVQERERELEEMRAERQREAEKMRVMQAEIQRLRAEQAGSESFDF